VASETGDASVEKLLRQTTASLAELGRRIDAVVSRAQALSETDPAQALQLLSNQPQEIQQHARVRELRQRLEAALERQRRDRLTAEAIRAAGDALKSASCPRVSMRSRLRSAPAATLSSSPPQSPNTRAGARKPPMNCSARQSQRLRRPFSRETGPAPPMCWAARPLPPSLPTPDCKRIGSA
jgi:hypothetical protein